MELIERELKWGGNSETVYFREMTGADELAMMEGQKYTGNPKAGEVTIDIATSKRGSFKQLLLTRVTAEGKQFYANLKQVEAETKKKLDALIALANEVHKDSDETPEAAGNV
jgi:hypothetical protein